jgi:phenylalanyl-tRNA synthetase beta subunit (EC 6.1.1.20)
MKAPLNWLRDFVDINVGIREYVNAMTMSGSKVEGVEDMGEGIEKVVVGKILSMEPHPNADRLKICRVDVGNEVLQIVTGAPNVKTGDLVPVALAGAKLPGGEIKVSKLRGVDSYGMMCSAEELNLSRDYLPDAPEYGVYVFTEDVKPGTDIKEALHLDKVVDFEITSNRPDCLSIYGLARESAVALGVPFRKQEIRVKEEAGGDVNDYISVVIENTELCPRYCARVVTDVKVGPSPSWMQHRLAAAGMRPINNIVDITNYVMLELGQPMHAFDFSTIRGSKIIVRNARDGEIMRTLDGQERKLDKDMLVIADAERAVGVAGVMGGENSEITENTKMIVLESANFNGTSVRITSKKLGIRSEASMRFEKGLDPENTIKALNRCAELIELLGAGKVVRGIIDCNNVKREPKIIKLDVDRINALLGTDIPAGKMIDIFRALEFEVDTDTMMMKVPSFRYDDIESVADLAEEVARFYDYNNIKPTLLSGKEAMCGRKTYKQRMEDIIRNTMCACGLYEAYTFSFTSPRVFDSINLPKDHPLRNAVVISNPLGEDYSIMRTTTLPDMLRVLSTNYSRKVESARLFELSLVYHPVEGSDLPEEKSVLTIGMYGSDCDFFELKGIVEELLGAMGITEFEFRPERNEPSFHPGRTASLWVRKPGEDYKRAGILGEIHPEVAEKNECPEMTYAALFEVAVLIAASTLERKFRPLPKFPPVPRDIAVVVKDEVYSADMIKAIRKAAGNILEDVSLFDVYKGSQVPEGMKSLAFSLTFRALDRTLKDEEVNTAMDRIIRSLEHQFGAKLR